MSQTGRYRFRRGWLGPILQAEWIEDEFLNWRDVERRLLTPKKVFAIVKPSEWEGFQNWRNKPVRKRKTDPGEVSRFA